MNPTLLRLQHIDFSYHTLHGETKALSDVSFTVTEGEFLAARRGLGYLIIYGSQVFQLNMVITSILILCFLALLLYQLLQHLEHRNKKKNAIS